MCAHHCVKKLPLNTRNYEKKAAADISIATLERRKKIKIKMKRVW